jgi:hypothetical protein
MASKVFRWAKWVALVIVLLVGGFAIVVAMQPADYTVTRSGTMAAAPATVFSQVNDFHKWEAWSPWAKLDPNAKNSFEGAPSGTGAAFAWAGNKDVGEGRMTITESRPSDVIRLKLDFIKPFASTCDTEFTFKPEAGATRVTWTMSGRKNFISKAFCLFADMDKMVGGDFEKGLANLKAVAEAGPKD